ncbi:MAG: tetratricopeptide repeat protein [Bdellovibrionaceae bacterium]|nr:tetratricopeptide repeat protein [Bdellovibrionales bacterium]MCB9255191.1 tetratricopeptide repeat protein [Pseudobdellovibrionaceae bacterium]
MKKLAIFVFLGIAVGYVAFKLNDKPRPLPVAVEETESVAPVAATTPAVESAPIEEKKTPLASAKPNPEPTSPPEEPHSKELIEATKLWNSGKGEEGIRILKQALEKDPNNSELLTQLGAMHMDVFEEPGPALQYLTAAAQANPDNGDALAGLVELHSRQGTLAEAEALLRTLPADSQAAMALADVQLRQGKAEAALDKIESNPDLAKDPVMAGAAYLNAGQTEEAVDRFQKHADQQREQFEKSGSKLDAKSYSIAKTDLANAFLQAGSTERAAREAEQAIQIDPHNRYARELLQRIQTPAN